MKSRQPLTLLSLPIEIQTIIFDIYFQSTKPPFAGHRLVKLEVETRSGRVELTARFPKALLRTCRAIYNIASQLLQNDITLHVSSRRDEFTFQEVATLIRPSKSFGVTEIWVEFPRDFESCVDFTWFPNLKRATLDIRRLCVQDVSFSLHLAELNTWESTQREIIAQLPSDEYPSSRPFELDFDDNQFQRQGIAVSIIESYQSFIRLVDGVNDADITAINFCFQVIWKFRKEAGTVTWEIGAVIVDMAGPSIPWFSNTYSWDGIEVNNVIKGLMHILRQRCPPTNFRRYDESASSLVTPFNVLCFC